MEGSRHRGKKNQGTQVVGACDSPGCFPMFPAICNHERPVHAMRIWCIRTSRSRVILTPVIARSSGRGGRAQQSGTKFCRSAFLTFSNRLCNASRRRALAADSREIEIGKRGLDSFREARKKKKKANTTFLSIPFRGINHF